MRQTYVPTLLTGGLVGNERKNEIGLGSPFSLESTSRFSVESLPDTIAILESKSNRTHGC